MCIRDRDKPTANPDKIKEQLTKYDLIPEEWGGETVICPISAKTGQRVDKLFDMIDYVANQAAFRVTTGMLNTVLADAQTRVQPPTDKGRRLKIYYMTQVGVKPPHFVVFCNDRRLFHFSYQRYLENQIRETYDLTGTPIRITIRQKGDKEEV